jgi:Mrp family chromosome partitioning ATPase
MYGLVLIDGGQAGSELSAVLARQADATYLVVELGAVEASQAQAALRDLRAAGGRVLGCIAT